MCFISWFGLSYQLRADQFKCLAELLHVVGLVVIGDVDKEGPAVLGGEALVEDEFAEVAARVLARLRLQAGVLGRAIRDARFL